VIKEDLFDKSNDFIDYMGDGPMGIIINKVEMSEDTFNILSEFKDY